MGFQIWSGRLAYVGASGTELAAIEASYYSSEAGVQQALDTLVEGMANTDLLVMLNNWRAHAGPFPAAFPGGGLLFGALVGPQGPPGTGANWRGIYDGSTVYALKDGVDDGSGNGFVSNVDGNVGNAPDTHNTGNGSGTQWSPMGQPNAVQDPSGHGTPDFAVIKEAPLNPQYAEFAGGARGNGSTDDTAAWTALIDAVNAGPGADVLVPSGVYPVDSALPAITKPVNLHGTAAGIPSSLAGAVLKFAAGVPGLQLGANANLSELSGLYLLSQSTGAGTDNGIASVAHGATFDQVVCDGFGQDGLNLDTTSGGNANNSVIGVVRCINCYRDGFRVAGPNSNVIAWRGGADASSNAGWGFNLDVAQCALLAPHAAGNTLGAFIDAGSSTLYLMPYCEGGAGDNVTLSGSYIIWIQGGYSLPTITNSGTWNNVLTSGAWSSIFRFIDPATSDIWALTAGSYGAGYLALANATHSVNIFDIDGSGTRFEMLVPLLTSGGLVQSRATPAYGTTVTPNTAAGPWQTITVTNGTAFTINSPTNPPTSGQTAELTIEVFNNTAGAMGTISWGGAFNLAGWTWANPATTKRRWARFEWDGLGWVCMAMAPADY